jgi:uncharacterized membrane protein
MEQNMIARRAVLVLLLILIATSLSCRKAPVRDIPDNSIPNTFDKTLTIEEVEAAIIAGGSEAGWSMRKTSPGLIIGTIQVRTHQASVDVKYSENNWSITYRDSSNLKYNGEKIHVNYNKWVSRLADSIRKQFNDATGVRRSRK